MHVDVSALQRDPLTKLPNRALLDAQLGFAINAAKNNNTRLGVLLVDMNNLKLINDQFGHAVGDCAMTSSLVKGGRRTNVRPQAPASYSLAPSRLALGQRHPGLGEGGALPLRHVGKIGPRDGVLE